MRSAHGPGWSGIASCDRLGLQRRSILARYRPVAAARCCETYFVAAASHGFPLCSSALWSWPSSRRSFRIFPRLALLFPLEIHKNGQKLSFTARGAACGERPISSSHRYPANAILLSPFRLFFATMGYAFPSKTSGEPQFLRRRRLRGHRRAFFSGFSPIQTLHIDKIRARVT